MSDGGRMAMDADVIVVGSGFGGSVVALRAAQAGMRVVVLERGRRATQHEYERLARGDEALVRVSGDQPGERWARRRPAAIEIQNMRGLTAIVGCGIGGGSIHYTSATMQPPDDVFDDRWPGEWDAASLRPYFQRVADRLRPSPCPRPVAQMAALEDVATRVGASFRRLPLALEWGPPRYRQANPWSSWRQSLVTWMRGDHAANKTTLDDAYLGEARSLGARIQSGHTVTGLRCDDARGGSYQVRYFTSAGGEGVLRAPCVVLAAGAVATTRLLMEARELHRTLPEISAAAGSRFSTNGDYGGLLIAPAWPDAYGSQRAAPTATGIIDYWASQRLVLMDLGRLPVFRGPLAAMLSPVVRLRGWLARRRGMRSGYAPAPVAWIVGIMHANGPSGRLQLTRFGRMAHEPGYDSTDVRRRVIERLRETAHAAGALLLRIPYPLVRRHPITVHPLGGCVLAESPEDGVCDPDGEVFGYRGLFVADGSLIPTALGCPPSMMIAAAAERVAERVVAR